ncbi:unnamed protein product [Sphenostylis stenocarpa]|uniref:Uncharacterized protein n=1 Tax=Sphenostylis stenocarpa TaxID=92480 RepID=A0AA86T593_9FABA|nr:unnamed protein product [Sphenostylis stenocarpa]
MDIVFAAWSVKVFLVQGGVMFDQSVQNSPQVPSASSPFALGFSFPHHASRVSSFDAVTTAPTLTTPTLSFQFSK